jgi:Tfp pilus assembly protein PilZ
MPASDRRSARRLIMKVPLKFRPIQNGADSEQSAAAMNISNHGVYFATDQKLPMGEMIQVHLKMPREVVGDDVAEWCFTGRVVHVESLGVVNEKLGVGVHFLYYEVPRPVL